MKIFQFFSEIRQYLSFLSDNLAGNIGECSSSSSLATIISEFFCWLFFVILEFIFAVGDKAIQIIGTASNQLDLKSVLVVYFVRERREVYRGGGEDINISSAFRPSPIFATWGHVPWE